MLVENKKGVRFEVLPEEDGKVVLEQVDNGNVKKVAQSTFKQSYKKVVEEVVAVEKVEEPVVVEKVVEKVYVVEKQAEKESDGKYADDDLVNVANYKNGKTNFVNTQQPFDEYSWWKFGDIEEVRFGTLKQIRKKNNEVFTEFLYIVDEKAVDELGLSKKYENLKSPLEFEELLRQPLGTIIKFIDGSTSSVVDAFRNLVMDKMKNDARSLDWVTVRTLSEKLDILLSN